MATSLIDDLLVEASVEADGTTPTVTIRMTSDKRIWAQLGLCPSLSLVDPNN